MRPWGLNLKDLEVERLAEEVARLTGESKTEAVRRALAERRQRLAYRLGSLDRSDRVQRFLEEEVWPEVPQGELGRHLSKQEEDQILGYSETGP